MVQTGYDAEQQAEMNVHHILREQRRQADALGSGGARRSGGGGGIYIMGFLQSFAVSIYFLNDAFDGFGIISTIAIVGLAALIYIIFHVPFIGGFLRWGFSLLYGYLAAKFVLYLVGGEPNIVSVFGYDVVTTWQAWLAGFLVVCVTYGWQLAMFGIGEGQ